MPRNFLCFLLILMLRQNLNCLLILRITAYLCDIFQQNNRITVWTAIIG